MKVITQAAQLRREISQAQSIVLICTVRDCVCHRHAHVTRVRTAFFFLRNWSKGHFLFCSLSVASVFAWRPGRSLRSLHAQIQILQLDLEAIQSLASICVQKIVLDSKWHGTLLKS